MVNKSGAIYWFQCGDLTCNDEYRGETSRTFGERFKEHLKEPSSIYHHSNNTGHPTTQHNFQIIGREGPSLARCIKESIFIRVNNTTLNRNIGKFHLPHIWYWSSDEDWDETKQERERISKIMMREWRKLAEEERKRKEEENATLHKSNASELINSKPSPSLSHSPLVPLESDWDSECSY